MSSLLLALQSELATRLAADPFFAAVPVLTEKVKDLNYEIQRQLDSLGILCVVMTPEAGIHHPEAPGPHFDDVTVTVRVQENLELNAGPHALEVAEEIASLLHQYLPVAIPETLFAAAKTIRRQADADMLTYDVNFETRDGFVPTEDS